MSGLDGDEAIEQSEARMILKFRELEVFWAVYKGQSVKEAARLLNVSQPAVSMMLKNAEDRFGVRLFDRRGGRVRPTPEARALFGVTDNVFTELQEFERQLSSVREGRAGIIRIAANPTLAPAFVHPAIAGFRRQHRDVRLMIRTATTEDILGMVGRHLVDIGITYGPTERAEIHADDFGTAEVVCVLRADHRLASAKLVTPHDLAGETVMTYRLDTPLGRGIEKAFRRSGADLEVSIQTTALTAAYLADQGQGVALVDPFILVGGLFPNLMVRPFKPNTRVRVQIVTAFGEPLSSICQDFREFVREAVPPHFSYDVPVKNM